MMYWFCVRCLEDQPDMDEKFRIESVCLKCREKMGVLPDARITTEAEGVSQLLGMPDHPDSIVG